MAKKATEEEDAARKQLPARSSRGTRIQQLVGEEADADASFWGQDAWREDEEDADYSTEEEEEDVADSDFDEREDPDEDVHDAAEDAEKDGGAGRKRGGVYREPMKATQALLAKKPRVASASASAASVASGSAVATPPATFQYEAPTVRRSTARKSSESSELRKRATEEAARGRRASDAKAGAAAEPAGGARLTQAQLLAEAVRTEVANVQSLSRLEQLEEEKKAESLTPKAPFTGRMVRVHSRLGAPKTITFLNAAEFPALFRQPKPRKRERPAAHKQPQQQEAQEERRASGAVESSASDVAALAAH